MLVLLLAQCDLAGQAFGEGVGQGVEFIEDGDNALFLLGGRIRNTDAFEIFFIQLWLRCTRDVGRQVDVVQIKLNEPTLVIGFKFQYVRMIVYPTLAADTESNWRVSR